MAHRRSRSARLAALAVLALAGAVSAPAGAQDDALDFTWRVAERLDPGLPSGGARTPADVAVTDLPVVVQVAPAACRPGERYRVSVDGEVTEQAAGATCAFAVRARPGPHRLGVRAPDGTLAEREAVVDDRLVVSIGDSVASGEGNPDRPAGVLRRGQWLDRRCHRSLRSAHAKAALGVERQDRATSITFVPLACSGATVPNGLLGPSDGPEPSAGPAPRAQVDEVAALRRVRDVDAVLLSVGGNDMHFEGVIKFCANVPRCWAQRFDPTLPDAVTEDPSAPTAGALIAERVVELRRRYDELAGALARTGVPAERVVVVEYFDPTHDRTGAFCDGALKVLGDGVQASEAEWAFRNVLLPMNREIRAAAQRHGWRLVTGVAEAFERHGYCEDRPYRWIRTWQESAELHGAAPLGARIAGTMHPNGPGHTHTATLLAPALAATLALTPAPGTDGPAGTPCPACEEQEGDGVFREVALTLGGALAGLLLGVLLTALIARRR